MNKYVKKFKDFIKEGIDVDKNNRISFNKNHEKVVNTSIIDNPTIGNIEYIKNKFVETITIFKRNSLGKVESDGNGLLYALKKIKGYSFKNFKEDYPLLYKNFIHIVDKIKKSNEIDILIMVPSGNKFNYELIKRLKSLIKPQDAFIDMYVKMDSEEILDSLDFDFIYDNNTNTQAEKIESILLRNITGNFQMKNIPSEYRCYITKTFKLINNYDLNNLNVIVVDDNANSYTSCKEIVNDILNKYNVKSIKILTLFAK